MPRSGDDDAVFARGLLDLYSDALDDAARGDDHRPRVIAWLGRAFRAHATGHIRVWTEPARSELCLWRRESDDMASTIDFAMPESPPPQRLEAYWYACGARRFALDWFSSGVLAELPVAADEHGFAVVLLGAPGRPDERGEARLESVRRHLEVLERTIVAGVRAPKPPAPAPTDHLLTARELEVLRMLGEGLLARTMAERLGVSERTVHKHLGNVYAKLGVHDRLLAVRRGEYLGLIPPADRSSFG